MVRFPPLFQQGIVVDAFEQTAARFVKLTRVGRLAVRTNA
jgi:hypothetical protein